MFSKITKGLSKYQLGLSEGSGVKGTYPLCILTHVWFLVPRLAGSKMPGTTARWWWILLASLGTHTSTHTFYSNSVLVNVISGPYIIDFNFIQHMYHLLYQQHLTRVINHLFFKPFFLLAFQMPPSLLGIYLHFPHFSELESLTYFSFLFLFSIFIIHFTFQSISLL